MGCIIESGTFYPHVDLLVFWGSARPGSACLPAWICPFLRVALVLGGVCIWGWFWKKTQTVPQLYLGCLFDSWGSNQSGGVVTL